MSGEHRFVGSMFGLALGDAMGAWHEGGLAGKIAWWIVGLGKGSVLRWSDDTQMAIGLAESLIENRGIDADSLARRWAESYEFSRGYGPGTRKILEGVRRGVDWREIHRREFPDGSLGNGAAMRAAPLGLFYRRNLEELRRATETASAITHAHPLGIEGGQLIARATALALEDGLASDAFLGVLYEWCTKPEYRSRLDLARRWLSAPPKVDQVRDGMGNSVRAHESAVTAVYAFCRCPTDFSGMMEFIIHLGGDTDTIGAMAGGIFGARNGVASLPAELLARLEAREEIERLGHELYLNQAQ